MFKSKKLRKDKLQEKPKPLIMLVDDEQQNLMVISNALKREYETICCTSGAEALDKIKGMDDPERIQVIVSDQRMPQMTGVEFLKHAKDLVPDTIRIILTGYTDVSAIIDSINQANIYKFITKPCQPPELMQSVMRACELYEMKKTLKESEKLKQEFINTIRHELRTPLNGIEGGLALFNDTDLTNDQKENLDVIKKSSKQMLEMVTSILNFTSYEYDNKTEEEYENTNLSKLFGRIAQEFEHKTREKGLNFHYLALNGSVHADTKSFLLSQAVAYVLSNALKFTSEGEISLALSMSDEKTLEIKVEDSGIGIEDEHKAKVFDMFFQADGSFSRRFGGLGVGLAIAKKYIEALNGDIQLESTAGEGATFTISVPLENITISSEEEHEILTKPKGVASTLPHWRTPPTVAVVEDNIVNQLVLKKMLESYGCTVHTFLHGKEFLEWQVEHEELALVFMDCQMPVMDGFETTKVLRESHSTNSGVQIVACTANVSADDKRYCLSCGMNDFIGKPISKLLIEEVLNKYIPHDKEDGHSSVG